MSFVPDGAGQASERIAGSLPYLRVLESLHLDLMPDCYLEIGVRNGGSLRFAQCEAIGVDPAPHLTFPLGVRTRVEVATSDAFFAAWSDSLSRPIELAFIDGMHLFEYALRDFMHIERRASRYGVVVVDDIFPNHPLQAARERVTRVWTGDVWKLRDCLERWRPDLTLTLLDTQPTGLMLITGLDPDNAVLATRYDDILRHYAGEAWQLPPPAVTRREGARVPDPAVLSSVFRGLRAIRHSRSKPVEMAALLGLLPEIGR